MAETFFYEVLLGVVGDLNPFEKLEKFQGFYELEDW